MIKESIIRVGVPITEETYNLSEHVKYTKKDGLFDKLRLHALDKYRVYKEEDIIEAVKRLKKEINFQDSYSKIMNAVDEIFGKKLI